MMSAMRTTESPRGLRLTVLGRGPAQPQPDSPASGLLVERGESAVMIDAGQGTIGRLGRTRDPRTLDAIVISHMHADHSIDLIGLRYLVPWAGGGGDQPRVFLPPGGRSALGRLATAISERETFFEDGFELAEYDPTATLRIGPLALRFVPGQHYVRSFGVLVEDEAGARLGYTSDTGPSASVAEAFRDVDLLVTEATLRSIDEDEPRRGHQTPREGIELGQATSARSVLLTHFASSRRSALELMARAADRRVDVADPGLTGEIVPGVGLVLGTNPEAPDRPALRIDGSVAVVPDRVTGRGDGVEPDRLLQGPRLGLAAS